MTLDLSLLPDGGLHWLIASGDHAGIVISSRIRLARNLSGFAFPARAREGERLRILQEVREAMPRLASLRDRRFWRDGLLFAVAPLLVGLLLVAYAGSYAMLLIGAALIGEPVPISAAPMSSMA